MFLVYITFDMTGTVPYSASCLNVVTTMEGAIKYVVTVTDVCTREQATFVFYFHRLGYAS